MSPGTRGESGLTIVDLLVTSTLLALVSLLLLATTQFQTRVQRQELSQAVRQTETRTGLRQLLRDVRRAGYDPLGTGGFGIEVLAPDEIRFTVDVNEDGVVDPGTRETFAYRFVDGVLWRWLGGQNWRPVLRDVSGASFRYRDARGDVVRDDPAAVARVEVSMPDARDPLIEAQLGATGVRNAL